jgi:hypothetical protein
MICHIKVNRLICLFGFFVINLSSLIAALNYYSNALDENRVLNIIANHTTSSPIHSALEASGLEMVFTMQNATVATWVGEPTPYYFLGVTKYKNIILVSKSGQTTVPIVNFERFGILNYGKPSERAVMKADVVNRDWLNWAIFSFVGNVSCISVYVLISRRQNDISDI